MIKVDGTSIREEDLDTELSKDCVYLLQRFRFYGHILVGVIKEIVKDYPAVAAIGCSPHPKLIIDTEKYFAEPRDHRIGILTHEILHIVLKHLIRLAKLPNRRKANVAADIVVNQLIERKLLPKWVVFPEQFNFPPNLIAEEYYDLLTDEMCNQVNICDLHIFIEEGDGYPISKDLAEIIIDDMIRQAEAKCHGDIPGNLKELIKYREVPEIDWRSRFRRVLGASTRSGLTFTKKRESKRYSIRPGTRLSYKSTVLFVIDSSGSISKEELSVFMSEVYHAHKTGITEIYTIICDADIQEIIYPFRKVTEVKGRGGTDFRKPIKWALDRNKKHPSIDLIVYLTDACGQFPDQEPPIRVLWTLTHESNIIPPFGTYIKLPKLGGSKNNV